MSCRRCTPALSLFSGASSLELATDGCCEVTAASWVRALFSTAAVFAGSAGVEFGALTAASKENVARDRFQLIRIVCMVSPFVRAWGTTQAAHKITVVTNVVVPTIRNRGARNPADGVHH